MRWPFRPPHLTLKPSKKNTKKLKTQKTTKNKNTKKKTFQLSVIFSFLECFQISPFLTPWPKERASKNTMKTWVSASFFWKADVRHETAIFGPKKPEFTNSSYHFFGGFSFLSTIKNTKFSWNPYFYSVLANLKKDKFQKMNLKHRNLTNPIFAPFFRKKKAILRKFANNWTQIKTQNDNWAPKNRLKPLFLQCENDVAQLVTIRWPS